MFMEFMILFGIWIIKDFIMTENIQNTANIWWNRNIVYEKELPSHDGKNSDDTNK